jgi:V/A-type H+-transporting ATPase subunit F
MEIALIGDRHTAYGFRLAGIKKTLLVEDLLRADTRNVLRGLFDGTTCIVLITERAAAEIREPLDEVTRFRTGIMPIVLEIPDSGGTMIGRADPMRELIKRTVGFEIAQ